MQDSCCMDALLCPDFDQARDLRGDRHARGVLLGQKRGVRLHGDFAANIPLRGVGHGLDGLQRGAGLPVGLRVLRNPTTTGGRHGTRPRCAHRATAKQAHRIRVHVERPRSCCTSRRTSARNGASGHFAGDGAGCSRCTRSTIVRRSDRNASSAANCWAAVVPPGVVAPCSDMGLHSLLECLCVQIQQPNGRVSPWRLRAFGYDLPDRVGRYTHLVSDGFEWHIGRQQALNSGFPVHERGSYRFL